MKGPVPKQPPWQLTAEEIAGVVGGTLVSGEQNERFGPVSIDTRTLAAGDLFFAIRGDRFDGHDFVSGALDCGARGVVVSDRSQIRRHSAKMSICLFQCVPKVVKRDEMHRNSV